MTINLDSEPCVPAPAIGKKDRDPIPAPR
jgi:hypothetical protein